MNERIFELARQAELAYAADVRDGYIYPTGMEKFAELIVRECAGISASHWEGTAGYFAILEHFGVEE